MTVSLIKSTQYCFECLSYLINFLTEMSQKIEDFTEMIIDIKDLVMSIVRSLSVFELSKIVPEQEEDKGSSMDAKLSSIYHDMSRQLKQFHNLMVYLISTIISVCSGKVTEHFFLQGVIKALTLHISEPLNSSRVPWALGNIALTFNEGYKEIADNISLLKKLINILKSTLNYKVKLEILVLFKNLLLYGNITKEFFNDLLNLEFESEILSLIWNKHESLEVIYISLICLSLILKNSNEFDLEYNQNGYI
mmetsp:Transcript_31818/g.28177  ORF Transcript_31818/g.28177 Transcript_31818/m.28177 type:complete len:250 (+) Transcript_31818:996-1745(+)